MRLPYPVKIKDVLYTDFEIDSPTVDTIAKTRNVSDQGRFFASMRSFLEGCVTEFKTSEGAVVADKISIKSIIPKLPYKSVEYVSMQAVLRHFDDDDGVEGIYPCPMCGNEVRAELIEEDGMTIDTRDKISELEVKYFDGADIGVHLELSEKIEIKDKKENEVLMEINNFDFDMPTLEHCMTAEAKVGSKDYIKLQLAIYVEALKKVNGEDIDNKFRNEYGMFIFGKIKNVRKDLGKLAQEINQYGIDRRIRKECHKCGKVWKANISTSNFFVSVTPLL